MQLPNGKEDKLDQSASDRQVMVSRRNFFQTYQRVALILQLLSAVAMTATFVRITEQHRLPPIFLILPSLLFLLAALGRCMPHRDTGIMAVIIGATTGAIAGFLSTVVRHDVTLTSASAVSPRSGFVIFVCSLEFLHIPVVIGAIMYSFCLLFTRLPPLTLVIVAAATAACATVIIVICISLLTDPVVEGVHTSLQFNFFDQSAMIICTFLGIFAIALMPALRSNKRAWLVCLACLIASVRWQISFLDTIQWDWEKSYFPISGALVALVLLFMVDIVEMNESANMTLNRFRQDTSSAASEGLFTAVMWHIGAYVVERTSLTVILDSRRDNSKQGPRAPGNDSGLCCLGMLGLLGIMSPSVTRGLPLLNRISIICVGLLLYVCITVTHGMIANGYFLDDVLGIALLVTTATSDFAVPVL